MQLFSPRFTRLYLHATRLDARSLQARLRKLISQYITTNASCTAHEATTQSHHGALTEPTQLTPSMRVTAIHRRTYPHTSVCSPGYGWNGTACASCGVGNFSVGGNSTVPTPACEVCPEGKTTLSVRALSATQCDGERERRRGCAAPLAPALFAPAWLGVAVAARGRVSFGSQPAFLHAHQLAMSPSNGLRDLPGHTRSTHRIGMVSYE